MRRSNRKRWQCCLIAVAPLFLAGCFALPRRAADDPVQAFVRATGTADAHQALIERIILDFNNDGREDMAVSKTSPSTGDARQWKIYLRDRRGRYRHAGDITGVLPDIYVEPLDRGVTRVVTLYRTRGKSTAAEYRIQDDAVRLRERRRVRSRDGSSASPAGAAYSVFRGNVEFCSLGEYLKTNNCLWRRKRS